MEISVKPSSVSSPCYPSMPSCGARVLRFQIKGNEFAGKFHPFFVNPYPYALRCSFTRINSSSIHDLRRFRSNLESLFCYDKSFPEEDIEPPIGLSMDIKEIGNNPPCTACEVKGAVLCATCEGSGLYVDSILESQGIIVKVRCLGCGGTGNIMCSRCGGRGHIGIE
ncbi:hypothetical protein Cni_G07719 [Canna indica]|uniref:Uncharacterized protein n=1 Tax=Canna indica TaxID=4628 RepID=A0AAQ3Q7L7_9LILI|nr:hypothetical protein Cni_G07719 [Canna indica]